jgi:CheY-like chemotaxis protein
MLPLEDNPADILLVELALKDNNIPYELTKFTSGRDALTALCPTQDSAQDLLLPDVILMDLTRQRVMAFRSLFN